MPIPSDSSQFSPTGQPISSSMSSESAARAMTLSQKIGDGLNQWKAFWFEPSDPLMLAVIRLLTAGMLFYNLCIWTLDFEAFFSINGLQPLETVQKLYEGSPVFSFWFYIPEPWLWTAHFSCLAIVFLFFTGTATRATSILSYLITISYSQRVPVANFGLDQILGLLCLYLAVGPCGACLSVDSWFRKIRNRRKPAPLSTDKSLAKLKSSSATVSLRLIQIHLCVIYFWAGFAKLKGDSWFTGEAMWNVIANLEYQTTDLTWMAHVPWLPYLVAHVTVIWELFFCVLVWNRTLRPLVLLIGTGMHFGIGAFLGMWTFGLAMTFCYFAFTDAAAVRSRWNRLFWRKQFSSVHLAAPVATVAVAAATETATTAATPLPSATTATPLAAATAAATANANLNSVTNATLKTADSPTTSPPLRNLLKSAPSKSPTQSLAAKKPNSIQGLPGTELLVVALRERHRHSLQSYFQNHSVPCRSSATTDSAELVAAGLPPAAILIMASELTSQQLAQLLDDLQNLTTVPILAVVSAALMQDMQHRDCRASFLQAPVTLKEIHDELIQTMWKSRDGFSHPQQIPNQSDQ